MKDVGLSDVVSWFRAIADNEKRVVFGQLLTECSPTLLAELENLVHQARKRDFISNLPKEASDEIIGHLDIHDLLTVQLVCKRWRNAVVGRRPFYEVVCNRLDVDASEYDSPGKAVEICQLILKRNKAKAEEWFSVRPRNIVCTVHWRNVDLVHYAVDGDRQYIVSALEGWSGSIVDIANAPGIGESLTPPTIQFQTAERVSAIKFLNHNAIFCGSFLGTVDRWNIAPEKTMTYWQHAGSVFAIDGNIERDILFTGSADRSVNCWRISTGELLSVVDSFDYWVTEVKIKPLFDSTSPVLIAVLSRKQPSDKSSFEPEMLSLSIFSYSDVNHRLTVLQEIPCQPQISGVFPTVTATADGFGFIFMEKHGYARYYACEYVTETRTIYRRPMFLDGMCSRIRNVIGLGKKYCLVVLQNFEGGEYLALLEKRGNAWKFYKTLPSLLDKGQSIWATSPFTRTNSGQRGLGSSKWMNGFRPGNTGELAFFAFSRGRICCAFWK